MFIGAVTSDFFYFIVVENAWYSTMHVPCMDNIILCCQVFRVDVMVENYHFIRVTAFTLPSTFFVKSNSNIPNLSKANETIRHNGNNVIVHYQYT